MKELWDILLFVGGLTLVLAGAEAFVRSVSGMASRTGRSQLALGMTVLAFGTSAPELAIGVADALRHESTIGLGNIVGSNIFNILVVLGLAAVLRPLMTHRKTLARDIPVLIGISLLFLLLTYDLSLNLWEGLALLAMLSAYLIFLYRTAESEPASSEAKPPDPPTVRRPWIVQTLIALAGIGTLAWGSHWLVKGAVEIAAGFGVNELVVGLTIVAVGTSLPEIATTLAAIRKGEHDLAIGNVIGSSVFNLLAVPGVMVLVNGAALSVSKSAVTVDLPIMIMAMAACVPVLFSQARVSRSEGLLFLGYYAVYAVLLYGRATSSMVFGQYQKAAWILILAMVGITLGVIFYRALKFSVASSVKGDSP